MIKLVASDIDGTILKAGCTELNKSLFEAIELLHKKGILFVAASGRPYCELKHLFEPVADKMGFVCNDGAFTLIGNAIVDYNSIELDAAKGMLKDIEGQKDCEFLAYSLNTAFAKPKTDTFAKRIHTLLYGNEMVVKNIDIIHANILKIGVFCEKGIESVENYFLAKYSGEFEVSYAGNQWLEFNAQGVNKSLGIKTLVKELGISIDETMAFGDSFNDIDMLECVKYSYAMESAKELVKTKAKYVCNDVEETIRKLLL